MMQELKAETGEHFEAEESSTLIRMDEPDSEEQIKAAEILRPRIVSRLTSSAWPVHNSVCGDGCASIQVRNIIPHRL